LQQDVAGVVAYPSHLDGYSNLRSSDAVIAAAPQRRR
jgi:hypothetical protein